MKVRMKVTVSGTRPSTELDQQGNYLPVNWPPFGQILECSDDEAASLVYAGVAEPLEDEAEPEQAPEPPAPVESAAVDTKPARRGA